MLRVVLSRAAAKDLRRISDRATLGRLTRAIESLSGDPMPSGARKLAGSEDVWRIRVGKWRVCYTVEKDKLIVLVLTVARCGDVYERLRRRVR